MRLESVFLAGLLITAVFSIGFGFFAELLNNYDPSNFGATSTFNTIQNTTASVSSDYTSMQDDLTGGTVSDTSAESESVAGGYRAIRSKPYSASELTGNALTTFVKETGIVSNIVVKFIIAVVGLLTVFAVVYLIFRIPQR